MKLLFTDFGYISFNCDDDYAPKPGEAVFDSYPPESELLAAFPGRIERGLEIEREKLAALMRLERDKRLREIYDPGTQMIRRELETTPLDPTYEALLVAKRTELHAYARALQEVPNQEGFPETITWPAIPTEELS